MAKPDGMVKARGGHEDFIHATVRRCAALGSGRAGAAGGLDMTELAGWVLLAAAQIAEGAVADLDADLFVCGYDDPVRIGAGEAVRIMARAGLDY